MKKMVLFIIITINYLFSLETIKELDINKFMGKWYVISAIPNYFENGNTDAYDIYSINQDNTISVEYFAKNNGKEINIKQEATILDTVNKSRWNMRFIKPWIPFFSAPYEVIILDKINYDYMVVGYPNNDYGWIMCRDNFMDKKLYSQIIQRLEVEFNYKRKQFEMVIHNDK